MKRIALILVIGALAAAATAAFAGAAVRRSGATRGGSSGPRAGLAVASLPRSRLTAFSCHTASRPADRSVSVRALMRPVTGTKKMEMRIELLTKSASGPGFTEVPGGGLDSWLSPADPTLGQRQGDVWIVPDHIRDLPAPALYHYRVSFRWIGTSGKVLATRTRSSGDCSERLLRPDLVVSTIAVAPSPFKSTKDLYEATVKNDGDAPTPATFTVAFTHPAASSPAGAPPVTMTKTMQRLDAGTTGQVTFEGPLCTAATAPTVVVDPDDSVDESDFGNNSLTVVIVDSVCSPVTAAPTPAP